MTYINNSDEELMTAYAKGKYGAFEVLYKRHKDSLYRYVKRLVKDSELANDLYQELWSRVIKSSSLYQVESKWTTWVYRIAHNLVVDHYRTFKQLESEHDQFSDDAPEKAYQQKELSSQIKHCMEKLPATQREVFLLSQETDLNLKMVSEVVGASHEAVKTRIRYARTALKECLARFGVVPTNIAINQSDKGGSNDRS